MIVCLERNGQLEVIMERCFGQIEQIRVPNKTEKQSKQQQV